jgi:outer membrane biosynthesis protein TonB
MTVTRKFVFFLFPLLLLLTGFSCEKKKAQVPQNAQAPTVAVVLPDEIPLQQQPPPEDQPNEKKELPAQPAKSKPKKPARNSTTAAKKTTPPSNPPAQTQPQQAQPPSQTVAASRPPKSASPEPLPETVIGAAVGNAQLAQLKDDTSRMIEATENTLKGINRNLSNDEKSMRSQIQSYMQQSRKAITDGDYERASLLAKKAQLLADALVKK